MKFDERIQKVVPSLELCKKIPVGDFCNSAFVWWERPVIYFLDGEDKDGNRIGGVRNDGMRWGVVQMNKTTRMVKWRQGDNIFPAPILSEILDAIADKVAIGNGHLTFEMCNSAFSIYAVTAPKSGVEFEEYGRRITDKPADAALRVYLQIIGVME